jgi:biopolymer transport protein ExbD
MMARKKLHQTGQGTLAYIALLLLIFFLITTQFPKEEGIKTLLPPMELQKVSTDFVELEIHINAQDEVAINQSVVNISEMSSVIFLKLQNTSVQTRINLKSHVKSSYVTYVEVYDQLKQAYIRLYEHEAKRQFGDSFCYLSMQEQMLIKTQNRIQISEGDLIQ